MMTSRRKSIDGMESARNAVVIEDYDPFWPEQFEELRSRLAKALDGVATAIEHVGSTAVPGLAAKPVIDVDVHLKSAADLPRVIAALASIGYQHRGDLGVPGREAFRAPAGNFPHHLYVCACDNEFRRHIVFRDYLRTRPEAASAYAQLKRKLAHEYGKDREAYTKAKTEFVESILRASARESTSKLDVSTTATKA